MNFLKWEVDVILFVFLFYGLNCKWFIGNLNVFVLLRKDIKKFIKKKMIIVED